MTIAHPDPLVSAPHAHPRPSRAPSLVAMVAVIILAAILVLRILGIIGHGSLANFRGKDVAVLLRNDSDPRAISTDRSTTISGSFKTINGVPVSLTGRITRVEADGVTLTNAKGDLWIPTDRIQMVISPPVVDIP